MSIINKLKLGISVFSCNYINTNYNKKEIFERMDSQLKKLDSSYIMSFYEIYNNKLIMFFTARITEYLKEEQNKVFILQDAQMMKEKLFLAFATVRTY